MPDQEPPSSKRAGPPSPLSPKTYVELRRAASAIVRGTGNVRHADPASLVHEAWAKLGPKARERYPSHAHFLAAAAQAMRQILVDRARRRLAQKRGAGLGEVSLSVVDLYRAPREIDVREIEDLLATLAATDPRQGKVVELKFYGRMTTAEIAKVLGVSTTTVENEWRHARAWLRAQLEDRG
jgi:RNA polymerase sigma-70 factor, ECF subfamily